jgi:hypothetical protein
VLQGLHREDLGQPSRLPPLPLVIQGCLLRVSPRAFLILGPPRRKGNDRDSYVTEGHTL